MSKRLTDEDLDQIRASIDPMAMNSNPLTCRALLSLLDEVDDYRRWERNRAESEASLNAQCLCGHPVQLKMAWEDGKVHCWECEWIALSQKIEATTNSQ